jgi:hypothetical protein
LRGCIFCGSAVQILEDLSPRHPGAALLDMQLCADSATLFSVWRVGERHVLEKTTLFFLAAWKNGQKGSSREVLPDLVRGTKEWSDPRPAAQRMEDQLVVRELQDRVKSRGERRFEEVDEVIKASSHPSLPLSPLPPLLL